jgi:hypothetical protein
MKGNSDMNIKYLLAVLKILAAIMFISIIYSFIEYPRNTTEFLDKLISRAEYNDSNDK